MRRECQGDPLGLGSAPLSHPEADTHPSAIEPLGTLRQRPSPRPRARFAFRSVAPPRKWMSGCGCSVCRVGVRLRSALCLPLSCASAKVGVRDGIGRGWVSDVNFGSTKAGVRYGIGRCLDAECGCGAPKPPDSGHPPERDPVAARLSRPIADTHPSAIEPIGTLRQRPSPPAESPLCLPLSCASAKVGVRLRLGCGCVRLRLRGLPDGCPVLG